VKVAIVGTGYVGLTTGVCLGWIGHEVTCLDTDEGKVASLRRGVAPIYEPGLEELLGKVADRLRFTTRYEEAIPDAEVAFIAVGTPPLSDGSPDLQYLRAAAQGIAQHLGQGFTVVVNKSTVPIGSGSWVDAIIQESYESRGNGRTSHPFAVASNPEFLREGAALHDSLYPDRVVIGADHAHALEILYTLYRPVLEQNFPEPSFLPRPEELGAVPLVATDLASAELIKYAANAFLALKISFINEISQLAEKVGADISLVAKGIGLDARIGTRFLQAGIGWGGSCFSKDTAALLSTAADYGLPMPIVAAARDVNRRQRERVMEKLLSELKILKGKTVGLLGLAFKPHTDDLRDAPSLDIARALLARGARVKVHDPVAMSRAQRENPQLELGYCTEPEQTAEQADALVLVTEWPQYRQLDWAAVAASMRSAIMIDGRHALDPAEAARAGFRCVRL
jgi:UDPglucose 6-dehydrogenase